jgi:hypothetical protein
MTAVNIILKPGEAHLLTDGAGLGPDQTLAAIRDKAYLFPTFPAAMALLGTDILGADSAACVRMSHATDFDELLEIIEPVMTASAAKFSVQKSYELHVVGWSSRRKAMECWFIPGHRWHAENGFPAVRAFELNKVDDPFGCINPVPSQEAIEATGWQLPTAESFDPVRDGIALMEAQRRKPAPLMGGGPPLHGIGGFVQHTVITPSSVRSSVIHRWPDKVGSKIDPVAGGANGEA